MKGIRKKLEMERQEKVAWRAIIKNFLKKPPEGRLKVNVVKNNIAYIQCIGGRSPQIVYIPKAEEAKAAALAQKEYYLKADKLLERTINAIDTFLKLYPDETIDDIIKEMHWAKREIIVPLRPTDEEYAALWQQEEYDGLSFREDDESNFYTDRGERVRSKSEVIIANTLNSQNIPYKYERPLILDGRKIHPDFTILDVAHRKEKYLEHFGIMTDNGYAVKTVEKIRSFAANGLFLGESLFCTFETDRHALDTRELKQLIEHMMKV